MTAPERPASAGDVDVRAVVDALREIADYLELPSLEEARRELRAEGIDPDELGRRMRERVESMLRAVKLARGDA